MCVCVCVCVFVFVRVCVLCKIVIYLPLPGSYHDIGQNIEGQVNKFKYQSSTVANNNKVDVELDTRSSNACKAFDWLKKGVWLNEDIAIKTKCAVCRVLYDAET